MPGIVHLNEADTNWDDPVGVLEIGNRKYKYNSIRVFDRAAPDLNERLPYSLKILLENTLSHYDEKFFNENHIRLFLNWDGRGGKNEISFMPGRVILQDFTGVPAVADLAAMRTKLEESGGDPARINPQVPVDLVIDHSVMVDCFGDSDALSCNVEYEYSRNQERYRFLKWAQSSFDNFRAFPPSAGIVHQVNLEHLADVVTSKTVDGTMWLYPDTLVGTDSHTTMINGIGVLGWGVGGIEAEAGMLGQPLSLLLPEVVGLKLKGRLSEHVTATDLALTVTNLLRKHGVVGKFVEFFGEGIHNISVEDRATVANMSPEYGATMGFFPVDQQTIAYLRATGRSEDRIAVVEAYCKAQGMFLEPGAPDPVYSNVIELDLSGVRPSMAGPKRPQDLISLSRLKTSAEKSLTTPVAAGGYGLKPEETARGFEIAYEEPGKKPDMLHDGDVVIAAITSCTNTSNPAVMLAAGLMAKRAVELGLKVPSYVKTSLAPGSRVVTAYLQESGLLPYLEKIGFYIVGYGCTTCIGNSGPLIPEVADVIDKQGVNAAAVLSGNRNFEGRVHPQVKMNYLASPLLVVACALSGTVRIDFENEPLGISADDKPVYLRDIWPSDELIAEYSKKYVSTGFFHTQYKEALTANHNWNEMQETGGDLYQWDSNSTYIQKPPLFDNMIMNSPDNDIVSGSRVLAWFGDSVTTDHISPAGSIAADSPAGLYLQSKGISREDFNSYGSRRGNHEVMIRGTFANIRIRNRLTPEVEGGYTRYLPDDQIMTIYDASLKYMADSTPLLILAGREYGSGSSRDWAAKGTVLLGVKAVIAQSFERIHRSNLVGMGVLPLQFMDGQDALSIGLNGEETFYFPDFSQSLRAGGILQVQAVSTDGNSKEFSVLIRIDSAAEMETWRNGGILPQVLRQY